MCDNEGKILEAIADIKTEVKIVNTKIDLVTKRTDESHRVLLGNGKPEDGMYSQFVLLREDVKSLKNDFSDHVKQHQEEKDDYDIRRATWQNRLWGLFQPFVVTLIGLLITSALMYSMISPRINEILQHIDSTPIP